MPFSVEELPQKLTAASFEARLSAQGFRDQLALPFAIGGENNDIVAWNPRETPVLPIYGLTRSGKTSLLVSLTDRALSQGYQVVLASPKRKGLREFDGRDGVLKVFQQPNDLTEEALVPLTRQAGSDPKRKPVLFLFDDCHQLNQMPASSWIQNMLTADDFSGCAFVFAGDAKAFPSVFGGGWAPGSGRRSGRGFCFPWGMLLLGILLMWASLCVGRLNPGRRAGPWFIWAGSLFRRRSRFRPGAVILWVSGLGRACWYGSRRKDGSDKERFLARTGPSAMCEFRFPFAWGEPG